ncbi:hypothetical protein [Pedobacter flavus]|uniref:Uncharacterized protein n=1 Tax=Pedobacter flavus TaxID=3113906 RepID=A0ABU7H320_9SPHI|nr:hypothetical protein [Pedobacter sp. VNH31]MEE1885724.1 hypothetical protein [Pedobacter sp. VNH31]
MIYFVNILPQSNGDHVIHTENCAHLPNMRQRTILGYFKTSMEAIEVAKKNYAKCNGCRDCSEAIYNNYN